MAYWHQGTSDVPIHELLKWLKTLLYLSLIAPFWDEDRYQNYASIMRYGYFIFLFSFDVIKHVKFTFGKVDIC